MPHYYLEGLENSWRLVRETPHSQRFTVTTAEPETYRIDVDIHYTPSKVLTVTLVCVAEDIGKSVLTPLMDDIAKIALRRADYAVIDYSLSFTDRISDGNFAVDKKARESFASVL